MAAAMIRGRIVRSALCSAAVAAFVLGATMTLRAQQPVAGPNVNMVRGTKEFVGDPYLQRQNEPSLAVSTRNPCHLFAGANDYRTVDIPDTVEIPGENTATTAAPPAKDAWLGWFKSFDCGATWRTGLMPGYPQDKSPEGIASPLKGIGAGADPTVRAGTNGLFFFSGMVFNRTANGLSKIFISRYIDDNNNERDDTIRYLGATTIDDGTRGQFADKPWLAVDIPRNGFGPAAQPWVVSDTLEHASTTPAVTDGVNYCDIPADLARGIPAQRFPAGNVYMAWTRFEGNGTPNPSKIMFSRSTDCGKTWQGRPISNNQKTSQGATIAVAPNDGTIYIAWREFAKLSRDHAIWIIKSTDGGKTFEKPISVATPINPFDQSKSTSRFRTNTLPTIAADHMGRVYVAWAERGFATASGRTDPLTGDARIVIAVSTDGAKTFKTRYPIADRTVAGSHQVMPALRFTAGKLQIVFYDFSDDHGLAATPYVDDASSPYVDPADPSKGRRRHTVDVAAAQASPADHPTFVDFLVTPEGTSPKISQYRTLRDPVTGLLKQVQVNPPNLPLYVDGTTPFIGDYIDLGGLDFVPQREGTTDVWQPNLGGINFSGASLLSSSAANFPLLPVFHATWTDHRDVKPPPDGNWKNYVPPGIGGAVCDPSKAGMRNANVYTSRLTTGLYVGSPGNTKPLGFATIKGQLQHIQRGFVVFLQNTTKDKTPKRFLVHIANQPGTAFGDRASFLQNPRPPFVAGTALAAPQTWRVVSVSPLSTVARTIYVTAANPTAQVRIEVAEVASSAPATLLLEGGEADLATLGPALATGGLRTSVLLNPDGTNPPITDPDFIGSTLPSVTTQEEHDPAIFDSSVTAISNVKTSLLEIRVPDEGNKVETPDEGNPDEGNPDEGNPDEGNPDEGNAGLLNTALSDGDLASASVSDVQWKVKSKGNTTSAFKFRPTFKGSRTGKRFQLFVTRRYYVPTINPLTCKLIVHRSNQVLVNIADYKPRNPDEGNPDEGNPDEGNPDEGNPDEGNATFMLSPGETATVTLRVYDTTAPDPPPTVKDATKKQTAGLMTALAADTTEAAPSSAASGSDLVVVDTRATVSPGTPVLSQSGIAPGGTLTLSWTLKNRGTSATLPTESPFNNRFVLRDTSGAEPDRQLAITAFNAGVAFDDPATPAIEGEVALTQSLTIPRDIPPGNYVVVIVADAGNNVLEADDFNNTSAVPITIAFNLSFGFTFAVQPSETTQDFTMTPAVVVNVVDGAGALVSGAEVPQVTLALSGGVATLGGTLTRPNGAGQVTFDDLHVNNAGNTYRLNASAFGSFPATSNLFAIKIDSPPVAQGESYETKEDQAIATASANEGLPPGTLDNDDDEIKSGPGRPPAGRQLTAVLVTGPAHAASFALQPNGNFQYTPAANYNGPDSFTYKPNDGRSDGNTVTVSISVIAVNDPPVGTADGLSSAAEDSGPRAISFASLLGNDSAGPNESDQVLTITAVGSAVGGSVSLSGTDVVFTPTANYNGPASFVYTLQDNGKTAGVDAFLTDTATVTFTITEVNDPPVGTADGLNSVAEDSGPSTISFASLLGNDSAGPANESGQVLTITAVGSAVGGTASLSGTDVVFTPAAHYNGPASFIYTLQDNGTTAGANAFLTATATASFTITEVNDPPSGTNDALSSVAEDSGARTISFASLTGNDSTGPANESGQALTITAVGSAVGGSVTIIGPEVQFTPAANYNGPASFIYTLQDNGTTAGANAFLTATAAASFTITEVNDPPVGVADGLSSIGEDSGPRAISFASLLANDSTGPAIESGQALTITAVGSAVGGSVTIIGPEVQFTPAANFSGAASFVYTLQDNGTTAGVNAFLTATATVTFTVTEVNDPPVGTADGLSSVTEDSGARTISFASLLGNDSAGPNESGQVLTITAVGSAVGGTASLSGTDVVFTPAANFTGPASFVYTLQDNGTTAGANAFLTATATASFTITEVNDPPTGTNDALTSVAEDSGARTISFASLTGNDSTGPANESGQALTITAVGSAVGGSVTIIGPEVQFTPAANYNGPASFVYTLQDNGTTAGANAFLTATATASFTVTEVNDAPAGTADSLSSVQKNSGPRTISFASLLANDTTGPSNESEQALTITAVGNAVGGSVTISGTDVIFTPASQYDGPAGFVYTLRDNGTTAGANAFLTATAPVSFTITAVNSPPTANDDAKSTNEDVPLTFAAGDLVANDSAGQNESGQQLAVTAVALQIPAPAIPLAIGPFASAFAGAPQCRAGFTPPQCTAQPYNTSQNLAFGRPVVATSTLPGYATIHAPGFVNDGFYGNGSSWINNNAANSFITIDLGQVYWITRLSFGRDRTGAYNDRDPGQFTISTSLDNASFAPQFGSAANGFTGNINGPDTVEARLTPVRARWVRLTVTAAGAAVDEIEVLGSLAAPSSVTQGDVTLAGGQITFTPVANFNGTTNFVYTACDDGVPVLCANATVAVAVAAVNDVPSFADAGNVATAEDAGAQSMPWAASISAGPPDEAGQTLTFVPTANSNPAMFSAQPTVDTAGVLHFTGAPNGQGSAVVSFVLQDNGGIANSGVDTSATHTFTLSITNVNDAPIAVGDAYSVDEDTTLVVDAGSAFNGLQGLLFNDSDVDPGTALTAVYLTNPANGTFVPHANGSFSYTPNANYHGSDSFTYRASDGALSSNIVTVNLTVTAVNDAPSFAKGADQIVPQGAGPQTVAGWATSISAGPVNESVQAVDFLVSNDNGALFSAQPAVSANGTLSFTPADGASGAANVTVRVHDDGGTANGGVDTSAPQSFTITVNAGPATYVVTNTNDSGPGSLRAAIVSANANPSADTITFNIAGGGPFSITPLSPLPTISQPVVIDGTTQPGASAGFPRVGLNGGDQIANGLSIVGGGGTSILSLSIGGFTGYGVSVQSSGNIIEGNNIGVDVSGQFALPNRQGGILIQGSNNRIGGTLAGQANAIWNNIGAGITVFSGVGNTVRGNRMTSNFRSGVDLGIDLGDDGVTANDAGDADAGANNLQNYPVLTQAFRGAGTVTIAGSLNSTSSSAFTVDFYANHDAARDGQQPIGSTQVTTDGSGNAVIAATLAANLNGYYLTATATDAGGNTSEFSASVLSISNNPPTTTADSVTAVSGQSTTFNPGSNDTDPDVTSPSVLATVRGMAPGAPVLTSPGDVAVVNATGLAYFTGGAQSLATQGRVGILDTNTNTITGAFPTLSAGASSLARVNQTTQIVYMRLGGSLQAIDGRPTSPSFNTSILALQVGNIQSMALDEAHARLYVTTLASGTGVVTQGRVLVVDVDPLSPTFHEILDEIVAPNTGTSFATAQSVGVNPSTNTVYVAFNGGASSGVNAINGVSHAVTLVAGTSGSSTLVVNPISNLIYAVQGSNLHTIDGATNTRIATLALPALATTGVLDARLAVHTGTGRVYVRLAEFPNPSRLLVVDGKPFTSANVPNPAFNTILASLPLGREDGQAMVALDEAANRLISTSRSDLKSTVIDTTTNTIVGIAIQATQPVTRIGIDAVHHRAYVSASTGYVQVIDLMTGTELVKVLAGVEMTSGAVNTTNHTLYNPQTGLTTAVNRIDQTGLAGGVPLAHGDGRQLNVAKNSVTNRLYAVNANATVAGGSDALPGFVSVIDATNHTVIATVPVGPLPFQAIAVNEVTNKVYVGSSSDGAAFPSSITVIDGATCSAQTQTCATQQADLSQIPQTSTTPGAVQFVREFVVNPFTNKVYVRITANSTATMGVLDGNTNVVTPLPNVFGTINHHRVNPALNRVYISGTNLAGVNEIHVLDGANDQEIATITAGSPTPFVNQQGNLAVNRVTGRLFATDYNQDSLAVINGATNTVIATLKVGHGPSGVAVNETLNRIYVSNTLDRTLMIIDGATLRVVSTMALPLAPLRLEVDESTSQVFVMTISVEPGVMVVYDPGTSAPPVTSVTQGAHGTVAINADGSVTYTANAGYSGSDSYTYTVSDGFGSSTTGTVFVTVVASLTITTASLPDTTVGSSYLQPIGVTGGTGARVWVVSSGILPGGINLNNLTGTLSGTVRHNGAFSFTIQVRDSGTPQQSVTRAYTVNIGPPVITTTSLPAGFVSTPYSQQVIVAAATGAVTWSLNTNNNPLLNWLSISSGGVLSGTPPSYGTTPSFTVTATDSLNQVASRPLTLFVNAPLDVDPPREGIVLETQPGLTFIGGNGVRSANLTPTSLPLPPGLFFTSAGNITGSATRHGTFNFSVEVRDCQLSNGLPTCTNQVTPQVITKDLTLRVSAKDQQGNSAPTPALPALPLTIPFGGAGGRRVAQVITVGAQGTLTGIGLQNMTCPAVTPVTVEIQRLTLSGLPDGATIASGTAVANYNAIAVAPVINAAIDERLAFIVSSPVACTFTNASTFDQYNAGDAYVSVSDLDPWVSLVSTNLADPRYDIPSFRTLIQPAMDVAYLNRSRSNGTSTLLNDGRVLIVGSSANAEIYDPATNASTLVTNQMIVPRSGHTATLLTDGTVLIAGGRTLSTTAVPATVRISIAEIFDPITGIFSPAIGELATGRDNHRAVRLNDGRVLITGGQDNTSVTLSSVEIYTPGSGFSSAGNMSSPRRFHSAVLLQSDKVLVSGGYDTTTSRGDLYDPVANTFTQTTGNTLSCRGFGTATLLNSGKVLLTGGECGGVQSSAELFDSAGGGTFAATGSMTTPRQMHSAVLLSDGSVLVAGGLDQVGVSNYVLPLATLERYDPVSGTFAPAGALETRRQSSSAVRLPSGKVFLANGGSQSWMTGNTGEVIDPLATPVLTTTSLPPALPNVGYSTTLSAAGGTGALQITMVAGVAPGLTFTPGAPGAATLSGTPATAGSFALSFQVTDTLGRFNRQTLVLTVGGGNTITSPFRLPNAALGTPYQYQLAASGAPPVNWTLLPAASTMPPGLSLSTSGLITGTPTVLNNFNFGVRAVDANLIAATKTLAINVSSPMTITTTTLNDATAGSTYGGCIGRNNGVSPFTWSLSGQMPSGMAFNPTNPGCFDTSFPARMLRETGPFAFTATVTDSSSPPQVVSQNYTIRIHATDQSFGGTNSAAIALPSTRRVAQVVRSSSPFPLSGVGLFNISSCTANAQVTATVWPVTGAPARPDESGLPLATATVTASGSGFLSSSLLAFPAPVAIPQHAPFAVVLSFGPLGGSCQGTNWSTSDFYSAGQAWVDDGLGWKSAAIEIGRPDIPINTLVFTDNRVQFMTGFRGSGNASATLADGRIFIAGSDNSADLYDPATKTATRPAGNMTTARYGATASRLADGRILVAGGSVFIGGINVSLATTEIFNPATGLFTAGPTLPQGRVRHEATTLSDGRILLSGGQTYDGNGNSQTLATAVLLDANANIIGTANMTGARYQHSATLLNDGRVLILGGWTGSPNPPNTAEIYDPTAGPAGTFTTIAAAVPGGFRSEHTATVLTTGPRTGQVLVAGGSGSYPDMATQGAFFDPVAMTFSAAPGLLTPRWTHTATVLSDGGVMIAGGATSWISFNSISAVEIYDPIANQFVSKPNLLVERTDHAAVLLPPQLGGDVAITGGSSLGSLSSRTAEIYHPSSTDLAITTVVLPAGAAGVAYPATSLAASGGSGAGYGFSIAWGALPNGLSMNGNGTITGTPVTGGPVSFAVKVTDSAANTAYRTFTITVNKLTITSTSPLPGGVVNLEYNFLFVATGTGAQTWALENGNTLPTGMTLDASGLLHGTVSAPTSRFFNVRVSDATGQVTVKGFSLAINNPLAITTTSLGEGTAGNTYGGCLQSNNGTGPYLWSLSGQVPIGMALQGQGNCFDGSYPARVLRQGGTFNLTATVTDSSVPPQTVSRNFTVRIHAQDQAAYSFQGPPFPSLPSTRRVAQVFRSSSPFDLSGLQLNNNFFCGANTTLSATVWPATGSPARPDESGSPLGTASITSNGTAIFPTTTLVFAQSIAMPQQSMFAVVFSFSNTCTGQNWPIDNYYRHGDAWLDDGGGWVLASTAIGRADIPLTTLVMPASDLRFLSTYRGGHASATLADGRVLLVGTDATAEIYDPATNTLTMTTGNMSVARQNATATLLSSGKVLIVGGTMWNGNQSVSLATTEVFDPATGLFSAGATMAQGRHAHTATTLADGKVLITGGWRYDGLGSSVTLQSAVVFNSAGAIVATPNMTGARVEHTATLLTDNRVLVVGGWTGAPNPPTVAEIYDPALGTFAQLAGSINPWPSQHTATLLTAGPRAGQVLIAGGAGSYPNAATAGWFINAATATFTVAPGLLQPRLDHTATVLSDGRIAFTGGVVDWPNNLQGITTEVYDPVANQFTLTRDMITDRSTHTADLITTGANAGKLAVASGYTSGALANKTIEVVDVSVTPLHITTLALPDGVTGQAYVAPAIAASGGSGVGYTFTAGFGAPPAGLSLGPNGTITGTPLAGGPVSFVVKVTDSVMNAAYRSLTITVDRLVITSTSPLPNGYVGGFYSFQLAATGAGSMTWTLEPGNTLPAGLTVSASGLLSGTTNVLGGSFFNLRATDSASQWITKGFSLQVVNSLGFFQNMGGMNLARSGHVGVQLASGRVLLAGNDQFSTSAELYNPSNGTTTPTGSLAVGRCYGCAVAKLSDGTILVAGGYNGSVVQSSAEYYDPSTGTFASTTGAMTANRLGANAVKLQSGKVLILGGHNGFTPHNTAELYDPSSKTFSATNGSMTTGRTGPGAALLGNGKVLVAGGQSSGGIVASAELYDPATGFFSPTNSMITARQVDQAVVLPDGRVLIAGGNGLSGALAASEVYDPTTGQFSAVGTMNTARSGASVVRLTNGLVLVLGGQDASGNFLSSAELFDPGTNTFMVANSMSVARASAKAILLSDGRVLITGGYINSSTRTSSVEIYTP